MSNLRPLRILLVEDHLSTRIALSIWLTDMGHEVEAVEGAGAALRFSKKFSFDLLICDIGLPDGDGRTLLEALREHHDFQAVAITGSTEPSERLLNQQAGFSQHLEKPVDLDALTKILGSAVAKLVD